MKIVGIAGSLRKGSLNKALLGVAGTLVPEGVEFQVADIADIPLYDGKAVAIMGASPANLGTARAQYHLRQILVYLNAFVVNKPEIQIGGAFSKFDKEGNLTDDKDKKYLGRQMQALCDLVVKLR